MKPRPSEASNEAKEMLRKMLELEQRLEKAEPNYNVTFTTEPHGVGFVAESGGQTRNAYYNTNQHLLDSTDVANKGASNENVNLDTLSSKMNTHDNPLAGRLDDSGEKGSSL